MNVRPATSGDADAVRAVAQRAWDDDYPEIMSRETIDDGVAEWYDEERIREAVEREEVELLVIEVDGAVAGFAHAVREDGRADILRLYVDPDHRREGVGTQLLERTRVVLFEGGADRIRAMVLAENELGNAFYDHHGFEWAETAETTIGTETREENVYVSTRG